MITMSMLKVGTFKDNDSLFFFAIWRSLNGVLHFKIAYNAYLRTCDWSYYGKTKNKDESLLPIIERAFNSTKFSGVNRVPASDLITSAQDIFANDGEKHKIGDLRLSHFESNGTPFQYASWLTQSNKLIARAWNQFSAFEATGEKYDHIRIMEKIAQKGGFDNRATGDIYCNYTTIF